MNFDETPFDDEVRCDYYVYVHRERDSGKIFHVGKGTGSLAHSATRRSTHWRTCVQNLPGGWFAEILHSNLSEIEAYDLESDLVEKYGGSICEGGTLTNFHPGGDQTELGVVSIEIPGGFDESRFILTELGRKKRDKLLMKTALLIGALNAKLQEAENEADDADNDLEDLILDLSATIYSAHCMIADYEIRRIAWPDLCSCICDTYEDIEVMAETTGAFQADSIDLRKGIREFLQAVCSELDLDA